MKKFEIGLIEKMLCKLSYKMIVDFAWRSAMRALPLLGAEGNFNYRNDKNRQKSLYTIFRAIDCSIYDLNLFIDVRKKASRGAKAVARAIYDVDAKSCASYAAFAAAYASSAAYGANVGHKPEVIHSFTNSHSEDINFQSNLAMNANLANTAKAAVLAAENSIIAYSTIFNNKCPMEELLLDDFYYVQGMCQLPDISYIYGDVLENFYKALIFEGCEYWANFYQKVINNGLDIDIDEVDKRLNIPREIRAVGASAVGEYLTALNQQGSECLNESRIIILGDKGAGKTSLARRLIDVDAIMPNDDESTSGVETYTWEERGHSARIWDFAGHVVTHAVHKFFLSSRCLYILVYDGRSREIGQLKYWLNHMKYYGGDSKAIILINERDKHSIKIPFNYLKDEYPIIGTLYSFSIDKDRDKLNDFRHKVHNYIANNPSWNKQKIPVEYYYIKESLEIIFREGNERICKNEIERMLKNTEHLNEVLSRLHELGICLWYKDLDQYDNLILNPEWISYGVYSIINWVSNQNKYYLSIEDFNEVFENDNVRYPNHEYNFLFDLMIHYELAFQTKKGKQLIIPHLLNEDRPNKLPVFHVGQSLMLRYKADQPLPPNSISRFIVRHNHQIVKGENLLVWRYGVVLANPKGGIAMVREDQQAHMINVFVKGKSQTEFINELRTTLDEIFDSYEDTIPDLEYRIDSYGKIDNKLKDRRPIWMSKERLKNLVRLNKIHYFDDEDESNILLTDMLKLFGENGFVKNLTIMSGGEGSTFVSDGYHVNNNFNFYDCNIDLQGQLNELAYQLKKIGYDEDADELVSTVKILEEVEQCKDPKQLRKKGIVFRLKSIISELNNEDSKLNKAVKIVNNGMNIVKDIICAYNNICQWTGINPIEIIN